MKKRFKMNGRKSKKLFSKTASRTHRLNVKPRPLRGGTRL